MAAWRKVPMWSLRRLNQPSMPCAWPRIPSWLHEIGQRASTLSGSVKRAGSSPMRSARRASSSAAGVYGKAQRVPTSSSCRRRSPPAVTIQRISALAAKSCWYARIICSRKGPKQPAASVSSGGCESIARSPVSCGTSGVGWHSQPAIARTSGLYSHESVLSRSRASLSAHLRTSS